MDQSIEGDSVAGMRGATLRHRTASLTQTAGRGEGAR
jgi:hypothetical protein